MESLPPEMRRDLILSLNTHRGDRPLSPVDVAQAVDKLVQAGVSFADTAKFLGFGSTSTLREIHRLRRLAPGLQELVGWGRSASPLSMTAGSQIARLTEHSDQETVSRAVLIHDLSSEDTRQVVETSLHSHRPIRDCIDAVLNLRPQVIRRHLLVGAVTSADTRVYLSHLTQKERDELLSEVLKVCLGLVLEITAKLAADRFTLLGDESFGAWAGSLPDGFEAAVNSCLEVKIKTQ